jgi:hypothetical protein
MLRYAPINFECRFFQAHMLMQIAAAVSAAAVGDTIYVYPGIYREQLIITKNNITLKGSAFPNKNPYANTAVLIHALYSSRCTI